MPEANRRRITELMIILDGTDTSVSAKLIFTIMASNITAINVMMANDIAIYKQITDLLL